MPNTSPNPPITSISTFSTTPSTLIPTLTSLTFRLLKFLLPTTPPTSSFAICAPNIYKALLLAALGSQEATLSAFADVLNFDFPNTADIIKSATELDAYCKSSRGVEFDSASSVWCHRGFVLEEEWKGIARDRFGADVGVLNGGEVRRWVAEKMRMDVEEGGSRNGEREESAMVILVSCLWFKGLWETPFERDRTVKGSWVGFEGNTKKCDFMKRSGMMEFVEGEGGNVCILPYKSGDLSNETRTTKDGKEAQEVESEPPKTPKWKAAIILPKVPGFEAIQALIAKFATSPPALADLLISQSPRRQTVSLSLPRFSLHAHHDLVPPLKTLGLSPAFQPSLDFAPMSNTGPLCISTISHDLFLDVNEEGTEMRAKTVVKMRRSIQRNVEMVVDRPFLWVVFDEREGLVLCCAMVGDVGGVGKS